MMLTIEDFQRDSQEEFRSLGYGSHEKVVAWCNAHTWDEKTQYPVFNEHGKYLALIDIRIQPGKVAVQTDEDIDERLVDMLADGIHACAYWARSAELADGVLAQYREKLRNECKDSKEPIYMEEIWIQAMKDGNPLYVYEDEEDKLHSMTYDNLRQAYLDHKQENSDEDSWDGYDCDAIWQTACLGEVVYG